jgi:uncharacterized integral membrane protein
MKLLTALLVMLAVALFSVQNAQVITVRFLHGSFALSQALVILLSAFGGALAGLIIGAFGARKPRAPSTAAKAPARRDDEAARREGHG